MTQHTPERWYVGKSFTDDLAIRAQQYGEESEDDLCIAVALPIIDGQGEPEQKANARLIAAAPEQNKALHAVKARVERVMLDLDKPVMISSRLESVLVILDAAIALATPAK